MKRILYPLLFFFAFSFGILCASPLLSVSANTSFVNPSSGNEFIFVDDSSTTVRGFTVSSLYESLTSTLDGHYCIALFDFSGSRSFSYAICPVSSSIFFSFTSSGISSDSSSHGLGGIFNDGSHGSVDPLKFNTPLAISYPLAYIYCPYNTVYFDDDIVYSPRDPYSYDEFLSYDYRRHNLSLSSPYAVYFGNLLRNNHLTGTTLDIDMSVVLPYSRYISWMHDIIVDYYGGNVSLTSEDVHGYFQSQGRPDSWADLKYNYSSPIDLHRSDVHFGQAFDADSPPQGDYGFSFGYSLSDLGLSDSVDNLISFYLSFPYQVSVYQGSDFFGSSQWFPSYSSSLTTEGAFPLKPFQPIVPVPEDSPAISMPSTDGSVDGYFNNASDIFSFSNPSALQFFVSLILLCPTALISFGFLRLLCLLLVKFLRLLLGM